jgi:hypothetical protein
MNVFRAVRGEVTRFATVSLLVATLFVNFGSGSRAIADDSVSPPCYGHGQLLAVNNEQILAWKTSTANSYQDRGHILGTITQVYPDHSGHHHFQAQIGPQPTDTLEVIYNEDFGSSPAPTVGMTVEACGDYITANAPAGPYPASPDNAIIHWVHRSPNEAKHPSGYMILNGVVAGNGPDDPGDKRYPNYHGR